MTLAISGHGTKVARALAATPTVFTDIAELGDINFPPMSRNEFDATTQNRNIDARVLGVLRRGDCTIPLNFLPNDSTHDHLTGLLAALIAEPQPVDGYKFTFPTAGGASVWVMSGQVKAVNPKAPVDGKLSADVTLVFSGLFTINGVVYGT